MADEMDENVFWLKFWKMIVVLAINIIWAVTGYWSLNRYFEGHTVLTFPMNPVVNSTK